MRLENPYELQLSFPGLDGFVTLKDIQRLEEELQRDLPASDDAWTLGSVERLIHLARLQGLRKNIPGAKESLLSARRRLDQLQASEVGETALRWALEMGRWFLLSKIPSKAGPHFLSVWKNAETAGAPVLAIDAAVMMAVSQPLKNQREWLDQAFTLAERATSPEPRRWLSTLYVMKGWNAFDARRFDEALKWFDTALSCPRSERDERNVRAAKWARARALRALGKTEDALAIQREIASELGAYGAVNGHVDLEIGECLQTLNRPAEAKPHFEAAHERLSNDEYYADNHSSELSRILKLTKQK